MATAVVFAAKELRRLMYSNHPELKPANGPNAVFANSTGPPDSLKYWDAIRAGVAQEDPQPGDRFREKIRRILEGESGRRTQQ